MGAWVCVWRKSNFGMSHVGRAVYKILAQIKINGKSRNLVWVKNMILGVIQIWRLWKFIQWKDPPPPTHFPCPSTSKILPTFDVGHPISNEHHPPPFPPLSYSSLSLSSLSHSSLSLFLALNDNQSVKRNLNLRMTVMCYQVLPSGRLLFLVLTH